MFLDLGVGILAGLLLKEPVWLGIIFSLLPDIDALVNLAQFKSTRFAYHHRDLLHKPMVFAVLGVGLYLFNSTLGALFLLCSLAHFVHDSIGIGWGVQWLWPFNTDHFSFLYLYQ